MIFAPSVLAWTAARMAVPAAVFVPMAIAGTGQVIPPSVLSFYRRLPDFGDDLTRFHDGVPGIENTVYFRNRDRMLADLSRSLLPSRRFLSREAAFYHR